MKNIWTIAINLVIFMHDSHALVTDLQFPKNLKMGVATSAFQIEGAWNVGGKSPSNWDYFAHSSAKNIIDGSNADVACNSYYKYKEDVALIKEIGLDFYRFSVSWPRILPNVSADEVNEEGIQYYLNLTRELIANGIEPVVTIYHWDHPQPIQDLGGWTNEAIVTYMVDYARVVFQRLGPYVKTWITINEPQTICNIGYLYGKHSPGRVGDKSGHHLCMHNILKAHAAVWHLYDDEFRKSQGGQIGLTAVCNGYVSDDELRDASVIDQAFQFDCGWILHPIMKGDYPEVMKKRFAILNKLEGNASSCLPAFSTKWVDFIKGTHDYVGMNYYFSYSPRYDTDEEKHIYNTESGVLLSADPSKPQTDFHSSQVAPAGFRKLLRLIRDNYNNPTVYIFEHGFPDDGRLDDIDRISSHYFHMVELFDAIKTDGCDIRRYTIWSLIDNFEWNSGFTVKFGLVHVDFNSANRTRTRKTSMHWLKDSIAAKELQPVPTTISNEIINSTAESDGRRVIGDETLIFTILSYICAYYATYF